MRLTISTLLAASLVLLAMSVTVYGQGAPPAAAKDATAAAVAPAPDVAEFPDAKGADAAKKGAEEAAEKARQREAMKKALALARDYLVTVSTEWQKDQGEYPEVQMGEGYVGSASIQIENKRPSEIQGMMVDPAKGLILSADHRGEDRFIKSAAGLTSQGKSFPLERYGFYLDMDLAAYRTKAWPGRQDAVDWYDGNLDSLGGAMTVSLRRDDLGWSIALGGDGGEGGGGLYQRTDDEAMDKSRTLLGPRGLVLSDEARPVGFATGSRMSLTGDQYPWRGSDLAKQKLMTFEEFAKLRQRLEADVSRYACEVRIVYRQSEGEESNLTFESEDPSSLTQYYYGYAVSPTRILVPLKMEKIYIQRFKEIAVELDGKPVPAKFLGAFLHVGAFLVELQGVTSPAVLPLTDAPPLPEVNRAMVTYMHERKFGRRRNTVWYNRLAGYDRGYENRLWPRTKGMLQRGSLVLDFQGRPVGMCLVERRLDQEKAGNGYEYERWRYSRGSEAGLQLYRLGQLAELLKAPEAEFDPNLKPSSGQEEKRLVWLGVETQQVGPRLAEMLDRLAKSDQIQDKTRRGEKGLRVTLVHKDSPAAKAGLQEGDILLEILEDGKTTPIELEPRDGYRRMGRSRWSDEDEDLLSRGDYLTQLLTRLGPGTKITLTYLRGTEVKTQPFTLEWSPPDFSSADKYKDEKTGLTVKNLTYDVRTVLRLADDQPGVIVGKVEEGEKAEIARIGQMEIITAINGKPIRNVEEYRQAMTAIQSAEKGGTAVFTVLWMGKSNMVKIEFP
jgi:hypothetical protein